MTLPKEVKTRKPRFEPPKTSVLVKVQPGIVTLVLPCLPPSKNKWLRLHWRSQQYRYFEPWRRWFLDQTRGYEYPRFERYRVAVSFGIPDRRRRDIQNLLAFPPLFDSLVEAGIIPDDSRKTVDLVLDEVYEGQAETIIRVVGELKPSIFDS